MHIETIQQGEYTFDIHQGVNGHGKAIFVLFVEKPGTQGGMHKFNTRDELDNWIKWSYR